MGLLIFPPKDVALVGDASVWISLVASGQSEAIIQAVPNGFVVTDIAVAELERGRARGRNTIVGVERLITRGLVRVVTCPEVAEPTFLQMVGGGAAETLDDGEAATLAYAIHTDSCALIDEKKATGIAERRYPDLRLLSTADIMISNSVIEVLGAAGTADAVFAALTGARMRVPPHCVDSVRELLGGERVRHCLSLPTRSRVAR